MIAIVMNHPAANCEVSNFRGFIDLIEASFEEYNPKRFNQIKISMYSELLKRCCCSQADLFKASNFPRENRLLFTRRQRTILPEEGRPGWSM
jgi:hypothetical protein